MDNKKIRRQHSPAFKVNVVMEMLKGEKTISQICSQFQIHATQAQRWKQQTLQFVQNSFNGQLFTTQLRQKDEFIEELYKQIGKLKYEVDWLKKRWALSNKDKKVLIETDNPVLSVREQCTLLQLNRSSLYYRQKMNDNVDKAVMDNIDEIYTEFPYYGSRKITKALGREGFTVNRKRVLRLMNIMGNIMGIEAIFPKKSLSFNGKSHPVFPYLMRGMRIKKPNQTWGIDITYLKLAEGFVYLTAVLDWYSRYVLSFAIGLTLKSDFCLETIKSSLSHAKPEIINSDQGTQFTSQEYIDLLTKYEVKISMDHRGICFDNIFTERLWRTVKYEEVYLKSYESPRQAKDCLKEYFYRYNFKRLHQSLDYKTPAEIYFKRC